MLNLPESFLYYDKDGVLTGGGGVLEVIHPRPSPRSDPFRSFLSLHWVKTDSPSRVRAIVQFKPHVNTDGCNGIVQAFTLANWRIPRCYRFFLCYCVLRVWAPTGTCCPLTHLGPAFFCFFAFFFPCYQGTASEATSFVVLAARQRALAKLKEAHPEQDDHVLSSKLVAYTSDQVWIRVLQPGCVSMQ